MCRSTFSVLPFPPYSLKISINILRYTSSFSKQTKTIDQEELVKYLNLYLLKNVIAIQYITCLFPTKCLKGIQVVPQIQS